MATQYLKRFTTSGPGATSGKPHASPIYVDADDNIIKFIPASSGTTEVQVADTAGTQTFTNKTLTAPVITGALVTSAPVASTGAAVSVTAALHAGKTLLADRTGGTAFTLPAATATGNRYRFVVSVACTAASTNTWTTTASDKLSGGILINDTGGSAAATADFYRAVVASSTIITSAAIADGGGVSIGDWVEYQDNATAVWSVYGVWQSSIDPTTPFS